MINSTKGIKMKKKTKKKKRHHFCHWELRRSSCLLIIIIIAIIFIKTNRREEEEGKIMAKVQLEKEIQSHLFRGKFNKSVILGKCTSLSLRTDISWKCFTSNITKTPLKTTRTTQIEWEYNPINNAIHYFYYLQSFLSINSANWFSYLVLWIPE